MVPKKKLMKIDKIASSFKIHSPAVQNWHFPIKIFNSFSIIDLHAVTG